MAATCLSPILLNESSVLWFCVCFDGVGVGRFLLLFLQCIMMFLSQNKGITNILAWVLRTEIREGKTKPVECW